MGAFSSPRTHVAEHHSSPCGTPFAAVQEEVESGSGSDQRKDCGSEVTPEEQRSAAPLPNFSAPAHWMLAFGVLLAACAGSVDTLTFRSLDGIFVSHVTGTTAKVGMRIEGVAMGTNDSWDVYHSMLIVVAFIFGSFLCGLVIPKGQVHFGGKSFYGVALIGNSALLVATAFAAPPVSGAGTVGTEATLAACLAAMACGLQNAMCSMHFGAIVRTTHVTGTATDIGSTAGRAIMILLRRGCRPQRLNILEKAELGVDLKKLQVLLPLFLGFFFGCIKGAFLHSVLGSHGFLVPAAVTGSAGFVYMFFRTALKKQLKRIEEWRLRAEIVEMEDALERAHSYLTHDREFSDQGSARFGTPRRQFDIDIDEVDSQIEHALEVMHDVEATLTELRASSPRTVESGKQARV